MPITDDKAGIYKIIKICFYTVIFALFFYLTLRVSNLSGSYIVTSSRKIRPVSGQPIINESKIVPQKNSGKNIANDGKELVQSRTASDILDNAINLDDIDEATSFDVQNGEIILIERMENKRFMKKYTPKKQRKTRTN